MLDIPTINLKLDQLYPSGVSLGYILLLSDSLISNFQFNVDSSTNIVSTISPATFETGSRVKLNVDGGSLPIVTQGVALNFIDDYWIIKVGVNDEINFKLARTLNDAENNIAIDFSNSGSGLLTLNEQPLTINPKKVLIKKELTHVNYTRKELILPPATDGYKDFTWSFSIGSTSPNMIYKHKLVMLEANSTIGDLTGVKDHLLTESSVKVYSAGQTPLLGIRFAFSSN
jgi:hypothetical protein